MEDHDTPETLAMTRPALTAALAAEVFGDHYWLRQELVDFCRRHGGPTAGGKTAIAARIEAFLRTGAWPAAERAATARGAMPATFSRASVIGAGWRCSQALRAFFEAELGRGFHFDRTMRSFIAGSPGRTLGDAIAAWQAAQAAGEPAPIESQFEYNRFTRAHREAHPGASHDEVVWAWHAHRNTPRSRRQG